MSAPVLALDLGTTACKAVLAGADAQILAQASQPMTTRSRRPGRAAQDPEAVLDAAATAVRAVALAGPRPAALVLSSAMHSLLSLDADGQPVTALWTWADARGAEQAERLRRGGEADELLARTGTPVHASSPMCKIAYVREAEPALFARSARFVSFKEFLCSRWLGELVVDESVASATGLFDLETRDWSEDVLERLGLDPARLSRIVPTDHVLRGWRPDVATDLGIPADLPVVVGATDGVLANLGVGADRPGVAAVTVGTSAAVRAVVGGRVDHAAHGLFCYVLDRQRFVVGGAVNNAGLAVDWLGRLLFPDADDVAAEVIASAARSPAGARGVRCVPRLTGERFPDYTSSELLSFRGLALAHGRDELCRALCEGVADSIARIAAALGRLVGPIEELRGGGGLMRSELGGQLVADACGTRIAVPASIEASALGAARLARLALGHGDGAGVAITRRFAPTGSTR